MVQRRGDANDDLDGIRHVHRGPLAAGVHPAELRYVEMTQNGCHMRQQCKKCKKILGAIWSLMSYILIFVNTQLWKKNEKEQV